MPNFKYTKKKHQAPKNPFQGKASVHPEHPAVWVLNLILAEVDRQVWEKERNTYPRAGFSSERETVLGNVPEADRTERQVRIQELKKKIKHNITTCREAMAKTKETPRLRDSKGNFPAGRGRGQTK